MPDIGPHGEPDEPGRTGVNPSGLAMGEADTLERADYSRTKGDNRVSCLCLDIDLFFG